MSDPEKVEKIDEDVRMLAAMAYGEASALNDEKEIFALASVLERQRMARRHATMKIFVEKDPKFCYAASDGNPRFTALLKATDAQVQKNKGMQIALAAAKNARAGGVDYSNGAYFWDGTDIKSNYTRHPKVIVGLKIIDPTHNIYDIKDSLKLQVITNTLKKRIAGKIVLEKVERGRYDHVYESTAGIGGTIFWKFGDDYLKATRARVFK